MTCHPRTPVRREPDLTARMRRFWRSMSTVTIHHTSWNIGGIELAHHSLAASATDKRLNGNRGGKVVIEHRSESKEHRSDRGVAGLPATPSTISRKESSWKG